MAVKKVRLWSSPFPWLWEEDPFLFCLWHRALLWRIWVLHHYCQMLLWETLAGASLATSPSSAVQKSLRYMILLIKQVHTEYIYIIPPPRNTYFFIARRIYYWFLFLFLFFLFTRIKSILSQSYEGMCRWELNCCRSALIPIHMADRLTQGPRTRHNRCEQRTVPLLGSDPNLGVCW